MPSLLSVLLYARHNSSGLAASRTDQAIRCQQQSHMYDLSMHDPGHHVDIRDVSKALVAACAGHRRTAELSRPRCSQAWRPRGEKGPTGAGRPTHMEWFHHRTAHALTLRHEISTQRGLHGASTPCNLLCIIHRQTPLHTDFVARDV